MTVQQKRTKVLMVYPKFPSSFWSFDEAVKLLGLGATMPPNGLATVAALLPAEHFDLLPIIDINIEPLTDEVVGQADLVMISSMLVQKESFCQVVTRAKQFGKPVVAGGPYPTSYRDQVMDMGVDFLVLNEAEFTLQPFVEDWVLGRPGRIYDEQSVRGRSSAKLTREGKPVITETPVPRWDLLKLKRYSSMAVQFSRGCPFNCEFCDITALFGHTPRAKSPHQLIAELEAIWQTGWRGSVFIVDDNFIGNRAEVRRLLPALSEWQASRGNPFPFYTEISLDLANDNLRDIREGMVKAGFEEVFCGVESVNEQVLAEMDKKQNRGDLGEKVAILQKAGLEVTAGFIIGNDKDKPSVFDDLFSFIRDNGIVLPMIGLLTAIRGTALSKRLAQEGRLRSESSGNNTHRFEFNFKPVLNERFLIEGYVGLLEKLFSAKNYYARCLTLRHRLTRRGRFARVNWSGIMAAIRIFYRNTIKRPDWEFIKFITSTLFTAPRELPEAIKQSVKFAHFRKITRSAIRAHRYSEKVESLTERFKARAAELKGDLDKRLGKLSRLEQKAIARATRIYRSLDPDFRAEAEEVLENCRQRLRDYANVYRQRWVRTAVAE